MAITKSWEQVAEVKLGAFTTPVPRERKIEFWWLAGASLLVTAALVVVLIAKTQNFKDPHPVLNLNTVTSKEELSPYLRAYPDAVDPIWDYLQTHRPLPNVGSLARAKAKEKAKVGQAVLPAQTNFQIARLKPQLIVRTPFEFYKKYAQWTLLYLASFFIVHFTWRWRRFRGDPSILPALMLLTGIGLTLAVSLRDPLRDTLEFEKFAWGVVAGCALLLLPLLRPFNYRHFAKWAYTPLFVALGLFILLMRLGSGPTGSDAKVNLGPFQPVELIKLLLVLFLAGYFARKWEWLRDVRHKLLAHTLPVMAAVGIALLFFFVLKDLGPALVTGFLFLTMFAIARARPGLAALGVAILVAGVTYGYHIGKPQTVVDRINMWQSPWDNNVRGGDQLAHSIWALSTGGVWGSGPGWGDPGMIPAGHTDLVLPAIGEEWGFIGVCTIAVLFIFLVSRAFRAALNATEEYPMFLAFGLGSLIAFEMLLISAGVLGAIPLSGVVSPFLSSGNTAMLSNFLIFAIILSISNRTDGEKISKPFKTPVRVASVLLILCAVALIGKAASYQVLHADELIARDSKVPEQDGVKRPQHNPRLNSLARELTRGTIYDRNGLPLATSTWDELEHHRADYEKLGINIDQVCNRLDNRHYPFGTTTEHLLGDLRTGEKFHASNASLVEHDSNQKLQGFTGYQELAAYVRYRHQPNNAMMESLRARDRTVHTSIDIRLQIRASELLAQQTHKGALVVMNPQTGDVLALASTGGPDRNDELLDRARYGQYPPGSTFKLVTAIAALRIDPNLQKKKYHCVPLGDGRVGTRIPGWNKPIRDDVGDSAHGTLDMCRAIAVSCNAYFAQLGTYEVGAQHLHDTAVLLDIPAGDVKELKKMMPFASYGQGPVLVTPFKMARVAATIANAGSMPEGRWVTDDSNQRRDAPKPILPPELAGVIAGAMRSVVTAGTGRRAMTGLDIEVAGKTGTAQMDEGLPHSWFAGFAPYDAAPANQIAFAVVVEHGGYGAQVAAPIARKLIEAARDLGIISEKK